MHTPICVLSHAHFSCMQKTYAWFWEWEAHRLVGFYTRNIFESFESKNQHHSLFKKALFKKALFQNDYSTQQRRWHIFGRELFIILELSWLSWAPPSFWRRFYILIRRHPIVVNLSCTENTEQPTSHKQSLSLQVFISEFAFRSRKKLFTIVFGFYCSRFACI